MIMTQRNSADELLGFQVFGERCSGTNYLEALMARNFPGLTPPCIERQNDICVRWRFGWKHGFPTMPIVPASVLFVAVFRHPETWLASLYRNPWHVAPDVAGLPFSEFIRAEWRCIANNPGFDSRRGTPEYETELNLDRHPLTGKRFRNAVELRNVKNIGFLSLRDRSVNCAFVRYEDIRNDPVGTVEALAASFGLRSSSRFVSVQQFKGRAEEYRPTPHTALEEGDRDFLWQNLDLETEAFLGYQRLA